MSNRQSIPLETQSITPECRANRGQIPAWWAAVDQLREVYDAQVRAHPGDTFELVIRRVPAEEGTSDA